MPFCRLYIIVTYRNGRGFAETGKKVKKKNLHEREENGGQHVARSGRQALGREKTGKTDCCGQRHHGASLTRSPGRQYLRLNHCREDSDDELTRKAQERQFSGSVFLLPFCFGRFSPCCFRFSLNGSTLAVRARRRSTCIALPALL